MDGDGFWNHKNIAVQIIEQINYLEFAFEDLTANTFMLVNIIEI